jgi:large subunit ribosomal protein L22
MEVHAKARFVRMSPRKVRLVIDVVRGMPLDKALAQLSFMKKEAAEPVTKLIASAAANAEHNFGLDRSTLYVKAISADGGPVLHRFRPRAFGRAAAIRKRMSHIQVTLENRGGAEGKKPAKVSEPKPKAQKKPAAKKPAAKRTTKKTESKE